MSRSYGDGEVERISVTAQPTILDNTYSLTGCGHLLETKVAIIEIYKKIHGAFSISVIIARTLKLRI